MWASVHSPAAPESRRRRNPGRHVVMVGHLCPIVGAVGNRPQHRRLGRLDRAGRGLGLLLRGQVRLTVATIRLAAI